MTNLEWEIKNMMTVTPETGDYLSPDGPAVKFTDFYLASRKPLTFEVTEASDWQCRLTDNLVLRPNKGGEPNWFHRWMQRLAFGFRWERVNH
jgi:hypothetical protein